MNQTPNTVSLHKAKQIIPHLLNGNVVPFMHSSPAIGKSSIAKQLAKEANLKLIDLRLTELDSSDLNGLPYFDNGKATFMPFDTFPLESTPIPTGFNGWLLLLDELNSASQSVQAAAYKLILDRMVGQHKLHSNVAIIACGNLDTDNAITTPLSSALISRFAHLYIHLDKDEWLDWASTNGINPLVTAFIGFRPELLYTFKPEATSSYASPRTWQMLSNVLEDKPKDKSILLPLVSSLVGDGVATEFMQFIDLQDKLPKYADIVNNPSDIELDTNLGIQWALLAMLTSNLRAEDSNAVQTFIRRMYIELQVVALKQIVSKHPALTAKTLDWQKSLAKEIFL